MKRNLFILVLAFAALVGCGTGKGDYGTPTALKMDNGSPPNCYALTDSGLNHDFLGVYCRTTSTTAPR